MKIPRINNLRNLVAGKSILWHVMAMVVLSLIIFLLTIIFLRVYTQHGSRVSMADYSGMIVEEAVQAAKKEKFDVIVVDSVYLIDYPGNQIIRQSPSPGSWVKPGRKVYLTVTKSVAEEVTSGLFPDMYGKSFENIKILLDRRYDLKSKVIKRAFDLGPKDMVLEAYFGDQLIVNKEKQNREIKIPKGSTIDFVLSQRTKGPISIPNLVCLKYSAVDFVLKTNELNIGRVLINGSIADTMNTYVVKQDPAFSANGEINIGEKIDVYLSANKPDTCP